MPAPLWQDYKTMKLRELNTYVKSTRFNSLDKKDRLNNTAYKIAKSGSLLHKLRPTAKACFKKKHSDLTAREYAKLERNQYVYDEAREMEKGIDKYDEIYTKQKRKREPLTSTRCNDLTDEQYKIGRMAHNKYPNESSKAISGVYKEKKRSALGKLSEPDRMKILSCTKKLLNFSKKHNHKSVNAETISFFRSDNIARSEGIKPEKIVVQKSKGVDKGNEVLIKNKKSVNKNILSEENQAVANENVVVEGNAEVNNPNVVAIIPEAPVNNQIIQQNQDAQNNERKQSNVSRSNQNVNQNANQNVNPQGRVTTNTITIPKMINPIPGA